MGSITKYNITILSDNDSWINTYIPSMVAKFEDNKHVVKWVHETNNITSGDFLFILSYSKIISPEILAKNRHNLVVHASALPDGKGWSPLTWQILEGRNKIPITLFEAEEKLDSGKIYLTDELLFTGSELIDELRQILWIKTMELCYAFIEQYPEIISRGIKQEGTGSYYPRRKPEDSCLDPDKTIREQFNLLRVVDNEKYPAYFNLHGVTYIIKISKKTDLDDA